MSRIEDFHLLPGAVEGMVQLARCGFELVVVTNQRGIRRGLIPDQVLRETEAVLQRALEIAEVEIAGFYYCPHLIEDECDCRKPKPGMLLRAAEELDLDLDASWMIGDSPSDVEAGAAAGAHTALIGEASDVKPTITATSIPDAAAQICAAPEQVNSSQRGASEASNSSTSAR